MTDGNLFGWPEAVWLTLDQLGILGGDIVLILTVAAAMVGFIRRDRLRAWLVRNRFPRLGEAAAADNRYDGVVFTVGTIHTPAWVIETYRPAHVGLIATEYSLAVAEELAVRARKLGLTVHGRILTMGEPVFPAGIALPGAAGGVRLRFEPYTGDRGVDRWGLVRRREE